MSPICIVKIVLYQNKSEANYFNAVGALSMQSVNSSLQ